MAADTMFAINTACYGFVLNTRVICHENTKTRKKRTVFFRASVLSWLYQVHEMGCSLLGLDSQSSD
jgi:hypothetical protein